MRCKLYIKYFFIVLLVHVTFASGNWQKQQVVLQEKTIAFSQPSTFIPMDKKMIARKYPRQNVDKAHCWHTKEGRITFLLKLEERRISHKDIPAVKENIHKQLSAMGITSQSKIITLKERPVATFQYMVNVPGNTLYNFMFATVFNGRLLMGTYNCSSQLIPDWGNVGREIMHSMSFEDQ